MGGGEGGVFDKGVGPGGAAHTITNHSVSLSLVLSHSLSLSLSHSVVAMVTLRLGGGAGSACGGFGPQQQPPDEVLTGLLWILTLDFSAAPAVAPGPIRFLISAAMVMKACSTLVALLALVSKKGIPRLSANSYRGRRGTL